MPRKRSLSRTFLAARTAGVSPVRGMVRVVERGEDSSKTEGAQVIEHEDKEFKAEVLTV